MAVVRFSPSFSRISGEQDIRMEANTLGDLCHELIRRYGQEMSVLLDSEGKLSRSIIILIDRINAYALSGGDTPLQDDSEVLIMPVLAGG
jgi:molybdopterin converting factor small subunit